MRAADFDRIEEALEIELPRLYRERLNPFPIPVFAGHTDTELWDDTEALIELNRELRAGNRWDPAWPSYLFAIGSQDSIHFAIDTRDAVCPVWCVDKGDLRLDGSCQIDPSFQHWLDEFVQYQQDMLFEIGVEPNDPHEAYDAALERSSRQGCWLMLILLAPFLFIFMVIWVWVIWVQSQAGN